MLIIVMLHALARPLTGSAAALDHTDHTDHDVDHTHHDTDHTDPNLILTCRFEMLCRICESTHPTQETCPIKKTHH